MLDSAESLKEHYDQVTSCPTKRERKYGDGFDAKQYKLLKGRKEIRKAENQVVYWKTVYHILFPDVEISQVPLSCKFLV